MSPTILPPPPRVPATPRLVLIESPYGSQDPAIRERNVQYARACVRDSLRRGEAPFASHLLYTQPGVLCDEVREERNQGMEAGLAWGACAHVTAVYCDRGITDGMRIGIHRAESQGRTVVYRTLPRPEWAKGVTP